MSPRRTTLYRLYDLDGALLYVGITHQWAQRKHEHASRQPWWREVTSMAFEEFPTREEAAAAEFCAITTESPCYNGRRDGPAVELGQAYPPHEHQYLGNYGSYSRLCYAAACPGEDLTYGVPAAALLARLGGSPEMDQWISEILAARASLGVA